MNNTAKQAKYKVETCNYGSDFQLLTQKEKRGILKNAKTLLKLQRENSVLPAGAPLSQRKVLLMEGKK